MIVGLVLAVLAALLHVYIFYMESIAWTTPRVRAVFRTSEADAAATKQLAYNQGFYNLFLAVAVLLGAVLYLLGISTVGLTLVFVGAGSMLAAALVLLLSGGGLARAALTQGTLPGLAVVALVVGLLLD
jgi:putative membrane protein